MADIEDKRGLRQTKQVVAAALGVEIERIEAGRTLRELGADEIDQDEISNELGHFRGTSSDPAIDLDMNMLDLTAVCDKLQLPKSK